MFGKIKDRLKNVFNKSEEVIEENPDEIIETPVEELEKNQESNTPEIEKPKKEVKESAIKEKKNSNDKKPNSKENIKVLDKKIESIDESEEEIKELKKDKLNKIDSSINENLTPDNQLEKKSFLSKVFGSSTNSKEGIENIESEEISDEEVELEKESKSLDESQSIFSKIKAKTITDDDFDKIWLELQMFLLEINIAYEIVEKIEKRLKEELVGNSFNRFRIAEKIRSVLELEVETVLLKREENFLEKLNSIKEKEGLVKILVLGVNGTGKTTSIAKIVNYLQKHNLSVVVAASDTFRAAATEQLEEHSKKLNFKLIIHKGGSDPAAVAFDAIEHAKARNLDVALIDTAGRMPNNSNLMMELQKIKRVSKSQMSIFVGDSVSGNDLIDQINLFDKGVEIDGVVLTKVDTDEKPGSIVTTAYSIEKPIYFLGVGQDYDDLIEFNSQKIAKKLFEINDK